MVLSLQQSVNRIQNKIVNYLYKVHPPPLPHTHIFDIATSIIGSICISWLLGLSLVRHGYSLMERKVPRVSPTYNNSRCVYIYMFVSCPRIVVTALNIWKNNDIFLF